MRWRARFVRIVPRENGREGGKAHLRVVRPLPAVGDGPLSPGGLQPRRTPKGTPLVRRRRRCSSCNPTNCPDGQLRRPLGRPRRRLRFSTATVCLEAQEEPEQPPRSEALPAQCRHSNSSARNAGENEEGARIRTHRRADAARGRRFCEDLPPSLTPKCRFKCQPFGRDTDVAFADADQRRSVVPAPGPRTLSDFVSRPEEDSSSRWRGPHAIGDFRAPRICPAI